MYIFMKIKIVNTVKIDQYFQFNNKKVINLEHIVLMYQKDVLHIKKKIDGINFFR